jgi:hypothetical protein
MSFSKKYMAKFPNGPYPNGTFPTTFATTADRLKAYLNGEDAGSNAMLIDYGLYPYFSIGTPQFEDYIIRLKKLMEKHGPDGLHQALREGNFFTL